MRTCQLCDAGLRLCIQLGVGAGLLLCLGRGNVRILCRVCSLLHGRTAEPLPSRDVLGGTISSGCPVALTTTSSNTDGVLQSMVQAGSTEVTVQSPDRALSGLPSGLSTCESTKRSTHLTPLDEHGQSGHTAIPTSTETTWLARSTSGTCCCPSVP